MAVLLPILVQAFALHVAPTLAFASEIISDITAPVADEGRALEIKNEHFWRPMLQSAQGQELQGHAALYADAEAVITQLPKGNYVVRDALREALQSLQRADAMVRERSQQQAELAAAELAASNRWGWTDSTSFFSAGQDFLGAALRRFADFGTYFAKLRGQVQERRAGVLPVLRGAAAVAGNVLKDCRTASKRSFDALKHEVYHAGAPRTPPAANELAYRIVDAASETRRQFLGLVQGAVVGVTEDAEGEREAPTATVTRALFQDMEPLPLMHQAPGQFFVSF